MRFELYSPAQARLKATGNTAQNEVPERNDCPASPSRKVFDATFYKKLRFAPLSKSGSQRR
jgi:hypothetical protein